MSSWTHKVGFSLLFLLAISASTLLVHRPAAYALTGANFQAGRIIDNPIFENNSAMSATDIQNFLNAKLPTCDTNGTQSYSYYYSDPAKGGTGEVNNSSTGTWTTSTRAVYGQRWDTWKSQVTSTTVTLAAAPYVCLKSYLENTTTHQNNLQGAAVTGSISAAQIIWNTAQNYHINPEVILTTLQKEQGLVTDDWPWVSEFSAAMGYACPDDGTGCHSQYAGFFTQVDSAGWQLRNYLTNPGNFNFIAGQNNFIGYYPCASGSTVFIQNSATAALYDYTPYQPDANVLNYTNPTGSSSGAGSVPFADNCATYGNRNFWWYFNTWFGSSLYQGVPYTHPDGTLVRDQNQLQVYLIESGQRLPVPTQESLFSYGYNFGDVKFANFYDDQLPVGTALPLLKEGTLFKGSGPAIYVYRLVSGVPQKQYFPTWEIFTGLGYTISDVMTVPDWEIPTANFATDVTATQHPVGTLVQPAGSPQVYYLDPNGTRRSFPNQEVFYSYRYRFIQLKLATATDMQLSPGNPMAFKEGKLLQGSGPQIYVPTIQAGDGTQQKSLITSWFCFVQMGYTYPPDVMRVQDWELNALPTQGPAC